MPEDKGPRFAEASQDKLSRSQREEKVLQFWKENKIFEKTLEKKAPKGEFVFYEGPPTANGLPGIHHLEARAFKDAIPRYKTMRGYKVPRNAGWDTHGLPVELGVEKELGLKSKKEIEEYGVAAFNKKCRESVLRYIGEWKKLTERIGYWVDFDKAYFTFNTSYIEAIWGVIAHTEKRKLLYKDYKVVPWCPRCGTALSSHELAQGYQDVKDISLYVKFKIIGFDKAYFLAWTTTPWTLPGNVALAVGPDITYVEAKVGEEIYVLAKDRLSILTSPYEIVAEHKGSQMAGMQYEPVYPFIKDESGKAFKVYTADFVTTEDGTGIVHTAVMYGQEDFDLGTKAGLPKIHLVGSDGIYLPQAEWLSGKSVIEESTAVEILKDLQTRNFLFKKESHTHSYPFCWRCKTRLIYFARDSWYIRMSDLRDELVKENEKVNWQPAYLKEGRFGEWLRQVKDWAISRERYWGTPLPIWISESGKRMVVDSVDTLRKYAKGNDNKFVFVRHGEGEHNVQSICNSDRSKVYHLTDNGRKQIESLSKRIKKADVIYTSPFIRTRETAEILSKALNVTDIEEDERLVDFNFGDFEGKPFQEYLDYEASHMPTYDTPISGGESYLDAKKRFGDFIYEIDKKHKDQVILVVTHGIGIETVSAIIEGADMKRSKEIIDNIVVNPGEMLEVDFKWLPHNDNYELDLHKPYIDEIVLEKDGEEYIRVKEVLDVWFDSGAMPFATHSPYPADFIAEGLDQTRGWYYTLLAIGVLMGKGKAYRNVISGGVLLDKEGKKMSKSVGNVVDPWDQMNKFGIDAIRYWMYSTSQPGEAKNYDEAVVAEIGRKVFNLLDNVYAFYELYRDKTLEDNLKESGNVLDKWIIYRFNELTELMTVRMDDYKLLEPTRSLKDFIDDLSTWYLRRSRDRLKDEDKEARQTLFYVLLNTSKLLAPFAPFAAEELYQKLRRSSDAESVHLSEWPKAGRIDSKVIKNMEKTRGIVSLALEARSKANIKIRQPLSKLTVKLDGAYAELIKEEVNVKEVAEGDFALDTTITPELEEEGRVRDAIRAIQDLRKERGLKPGDKMQYEVPAEMQELFRKHAEEIKSSTNIEF